jgi:hypothetical protein
MKYLKRFNENQNQKDLKQIYLDDVRTPVDFQNWIIVRNYDDFVKKVKELGLENINRISLDHDLADYRYDEDGEKIEKTGYDAAHFLVEYALDTYPENFPLVTVHSDNNVGSNNIVARINGFLKYKGLEANCKRDKIPHTV